ncbi:hypothetical protein LTS18_006400 [Coniosporium uncinatum]|uniref:Uncharacterized protein n=1 Tax=Coniosporium uncinatum TaxID=93489 RepID=A0ACC3D411_9PEZI|nr:hypothetical protein LTS18_006400 [Coniosporium uncinatum]
MYAQQAQDRAQELMGQAKHQGNKASEQLKQNTGMDQGQASGSGVSSGDFPSAPREEPIASANDPEPVPAT